jgi:hypothetical protein
MRMVICLRIHTIFFFFPQLLNVHNVSDVRQIEAEPSVPGPIRLSAIAKLKKYKSPGSDEINISCSCKFKVVRG